MSKIKKIALQLYPICNRKCDWCPAFSQYSFHHDKYITFEILDRIIDSINTSDIYADSLYITMTRYFEPLIDFDFTMKCLKYLKDNIKRTIRIELHTNGDAMTSDIYKKLKQFDVVIVNRYGDSFEEIFSRFIEISECDISYNQKENTLKSNDGKIIFLINSEQQQFSNRGSSNKKMILNKRTKDCQVIGNILGVDSNGDIYPCCETSGFCGKHINEMKCGNVEVDKIEDIYKNIKGIDWRTKDSCKYCEIVEEEYDRFEDML